MITFYNSFRILIFCFFFSVFFISCSNDDGYSLDEYWRSIVTVNDLGDGVYDFTLDSGERLWIAAPTNIKLNPKYGRAIIDYNILSGKQGAYDHYIKLNGFSEILTKNIIYIPKEDRDKQDSIGNDPIKILSIWEGGGYMNISYEYKTEWQTSHMLNLVSMDQDLSINSDTVRLEFRHKSLDDDQNGYKGWGYVCFDLKPYSMLDRMKIRINVSVRDFDNSIKTYRLIYDKTPNTLLQQKIINKYNEFTNLNIY